MGCKRHVPSGWAVSVWRDKLHAMGYGDMVICAFLDYSFPIGHSSEFLPSPSSRNHGCPHSFPREVDTFIRKEVGELATFGPLMNKFLCSCLREVAILGAIHEVEIRAVHIEGMNNIAMRTGPCSTISWN